MIAHRLSTVQDADEVTALITKKNGTEESRDVIAETVMKDPVPQIIERGTHEALLAQGGRYASMWKDYQTSAQWKVGKEGK